jgi:predicted DsbA family dithiol-disulfide isomerase
MSLPIQIYSDYVCPFCFLAEVVLDEVTRDQDVMVEWMPFELRPEPSPTLRPEDDYLPTVWKKSVYPLAAQMGVRIVLPRVSPQPHTRLAFEGYQFAREHGLGREYTHRIFTAFFQEERDIGDIAVLTEHAAEIGLDGMSFRKALLEGRYTRAHREALHHAYNEARIMSVPTFVIGDRKIQGVPEPETLAAAIDQAEARHRV